MENGSVGRDNLTVAEAAAALNLKISTVRAWVLRRKIAYRKIGARAVRIPATEIDRLNREGYVPARRGSHE